MNGANIQKRGKTLPAVLGAVLLMLSACSEIIRNHGYVPPEGDLNALIVGVDTRDTLAASIGRPSTSGVVQDQSWYYIGSQVRHFGARKPEEINREVVAISFNDSGTVSNIERFGLERGKVVVLSRRVTETSVRDVTFIRQIIRNFGNFDFADALDG